MKTIFTLFSSMLMSIAVFAAAPKSGSSISIRATDQADIRVVVDGKRFEPNNHALMISNIESGYHTVKIFRQKSNGLYSVIGKRYEMVYNASVLVRVKTSVSFTIDRSGRTTLTEQKMNNGRGGRNNDNRDWSDNNAYDYDRDGTWGEYETNEGRYESNRTISDRDFSAVLSNIQKEWLESNKLKSAQHIVSTNFFSAAQVKLMLQLFSFESNKLDLAKLAYAKTVDQKNFYATISDAFAFSSSKDELARFIRSSR